jgi:hypothetical protein
MLVVGTVAMVSFNDFVHEGSEVIETFVGTTINTNARVSPFGTREDGLFESEAILVFSIFALFPDLRGEALGKK